MRKFTKNILESKKTKELETYKMKEYYNSMDLVVANLEYISKECNDFGPMAVTTEQRYIFEIIEEDSKTKYREVFTGFVADTDSHYFNLPYIVNIQSLKEAVPNIADVIPRLGLLLTINDVNSINNKIEKNREQQELNLKK